MKIIFFVCILIINLNYLCAQTTEPQNGAARICLSCEGGGSGGSGGATISCTGLSSTLYVDASRATDGNGKSWVTAKKTLQGALAIANRCSQITLIRVAKGTYRASTTVNATTRDNNFFIGDSYSISGGYPGGAGSDSSIRDFVNNPTILDGEIQDLYESYHCIAVYGVTGNIIIDGFQIKNGFADGTGSVVLEPGVSMARNMGAAMYIRDAANVIVRNCAFYTNVASNEGGAIYSYDANLTLENCVFVNNTTGNDGSAIYAQAASTLNITNCTFNNNLSYSGSAIVYATASCSINTKNCIIWGPNPGLGGGSTKNTTYSLVKDGNMNNNCLFDNPMFFNIEDLNGADNKWFTPDDGLALLDCSPAINRGSNNLPASLAKDITLNVRPRTEQADMGAYEKQQAPEITSSSQRSINNDSTDTWFYDGVTALTAKNNCRIIARLFPLNNDGSVGRIKAKTYIDATNISFDGAPLVNRHYNIDDSEAAPNGINIITLYFSNSDFTNYNVRANAFAKLPTTSATNPEQNIRIVHFKANSPTGTPESYNIQPNYLTPVSVTWLSAASTWRIIFNPPTRGLGGFFLTAIKNYEFTGNGNWSVASNWLNNEIPPANLPSYYKIIIKQNTNAILNVNQTLSKNATMNVQGGASLTIQNTLDINGDLKINTGLPSRNITTSGQ